MRHRGGGVTLCLLTLVRPWAHAQQGPHSRHGDAPFPGPRPQTDEGRPSRRTPHPTQHSSPFHPGSPRQSQVSVISTRGTKKPHSTNASLRPPMTWAGDARRPSLPAPDPTSDPAPPSPASDPPASRSALKTRPRSTGLCSPLPQPHPLLHKLGATNPAAGKC